MKKNTENKSSLSNTKDFFHLSSKIKICLEGLDIATNKKHLSDKEYKSKKISLSKTLSDMGELTTHYKINTNTLIHTAWSILLHRYTDNSEVTYGTGECAHYDLNSIIINDTLIPAKTTLSDKLTTLEFIQSIETTLSAKRKKLVSDDNQETDTQFQMRYLILTVSNTKKSNKQEIPLDISHHPLILFIHPKKNDVEFFYHTDAYMESSIDNITTHFTTLLNALIIQIQDKVTQLFILTDEEAKNTLSLWNKNIKLDEANKNHTFNDLFHKQAKLHKDTTAVVCEENSLTYQELDRLSNQLGRWLQQNKINADDKVAVLMDRTPQNIIAMLAVFKIGAVYIPINPNYPQDRINFILNDSHEKIILTDNVTKIPDSLQYKASFFINYDFFNEIEDKALAITVHPNQIAYINYTTGTTGRPKGVQIKHSSLMNLIAGYQACYQITKEDKSAQFASQSFDNYFSETLPFLSIGATLHIINDSNKFTPKLFLNWIEKEKITVCDLPTAYAKIILKTNASHTLPLKILKISGEKLTKMITGPYTFDIWNCYGVTEATIESTNAKIYEANSTPSATALLQSPAIGKPMQNVEVYVVDNHLQPVPIGVPGELLIGGAGLSPGYLFQEDLTSEKFISNPFTSDTNEKVFKTGDLVRWRNDGNLEFVGRLTDRIKIEGIRIELNEIEKELSEYPDVSEAVVISKELSNGEKSLIAYLVPNLDKIRIPYQQKCLLSLGEGKFYDLMTDDISKSGATISGLTENITPSKKIRLYLLLPGMSHQKWLPGKIVWQQHNRAGIQFELNPEQANQLDQSIKYHLSTNNLIDVLQSVIIKRNLQTAIRKKLPSHMTPTLLTVLPKFSLTFNGKIDWKSLPPPHDYKLLLKNNTEPATEIEKSLSKIWCEILHLDKVNITDNFFDLGGNSLLATRLLIAILNKFSITIPTKTFLNLPYISTLAEYILSDGQTYHHHNLIQDLITHDSRLAEDITPTHKSNDRIHGILLTGSTNFLGAHILEELLEQTSVKIYCLVDSGQFQSAAINFQHHIDALKFSNKIYLSNTRIIILEGSPSKHMLGLSSEKYESLSERIDIIYHCEASNHLISPYSDLREKNVLSTKELIKFSTHNINKRIVYLSSLLAFNQSPSGAKLNEDFSRDNDCHGLTGGLPQTACVSEHLITQIKDRGLPVTIFRYKNVLGHSETGISDTNNALLLLLKGCIELGYAPDWNERIDFLPVDFISKAIVAITLSQPEKNKVYHLENSHGIMWSDLIKWLTNNYYTIQTCSHQEWIMKLIDAAENNVLFPLLPLYLTKEATSNIHNSRHTNTEHVLEKLEMQYPKIDETILNTYINHLINIKFLPERSKRKISSN
ncbi:MAG: amino acid adenylation domain-containing protein [Gammaproteobacteria bacterium]|nr:amino acid adenylation domain-containing protein [Gammaproteobacteria bacterium]